MAHHGVPVLPPPGRARAPAHRRDGYFIDQVAEERRLGENLGVEKRCCRLQRNGGKLVQAMEPARRMDVAQRNREHHAAHDRAE
jgi:hypothetical protein